MRKQNVVLAIPCWVILSHINAVRLKIRLNFVVAQDNLHLEFNKYILFTAKRHIVGVMGSPFLQMHVPILEL